MSITVTEAYEDLAWEEGFVPDDGPSVSYPITLLLDRLQAEIGNIRQDLAQRLDRIEAKLDAKAERSDVTALEHRISLLETAAERRAGELSAVREQQQVFRGWKQWWPVWLVSAGTLAALILSLVRH